RFRAMRRSGAAALRDATTTSWACLSGARHSCCESFCRCDAFRRRQPGAKERRMANFLTRFFHSISEGLHNMFTKDIGIDLGTANTLVYMKGRGIIMREPSVVAVDTRTEELRVRSVGREAKAVIGRAPGSIVAVRPLKDGVIADFDITAAMLQSFIRQACGRRWFARP